MNLNKSDLSHLLGFPMFLLVFGSICLLVSLVLHYGFSGVFGGSVHGDTGYTSKEYQPVRAFMIKVLRIIGLIAITVSIILGFTQLF